MTARAEVEDILAEAAWRERNGLDQAAAGVNGEPPALVAAQRLRTHELDNYRDWPGGDAYDDLPMVRTTPLAVVSAVISTLLFVAASLVRHWLLHR